MRPVVLAVTLSARGSGHHYTYVQVPFHFWLMPLPNHKHAELPLAVGVLNFKFL